MNPILIQKDILGTVRYVMLNPGENTCNKFLSEVANCPFNEQEVQQKVCTLFSKCVGRTLCKSVSVCDV